ncbi:hypothetical protein [Nocardia alni]|uniref:hypothetical protein n=1 Tax=Nocardia alni TaxID=2815723 RepID=UPI0020B334D1|nr:hypothetical protein [Nocardia alni]
MAQQPGESEAPQSTDAEAPQSGEPAAQQRRNLVIVRAGDSSQHAVWLSGPGDRNWDLIVGYAGDDPEPFQSPDITLVEAKGPKWPALHQVIDELSDTIAGYDYIWLPDDHIEADLASINAMFDIIAEYHLSLAQPAFSTDSHADHDITRVVAGNVLRYTNFVDTVAPCFSHSLLRSCLAEFADTTTGLGLSSMWPTIPAQDQIAIVDAVTVRSVQAHPAPDPQAIDGEDDRVTELERFLTANELELVVPKVARAIAADPDNPLVAAPEPEPDHRLAPLDPREPLDPSRCVILVPVADSIEPDCARGLFELEQLGYPVWRVYGASGIDQVRSQMASDALAAGFDELFWIDADISFPVDAVEQLRRLNLPISCAIYSKKGQRELVVHLSPGTQHMTFGVGGGLAEIKYGATGFLLTKREVYENIQEHEGLPTCNKQFGRPVVPYFLPMAVPVGENFWYLGEDFAFCERAHRCGYRVMADTRIRLGHIGRQTYEWEDAGSARERFSSFTFNF